MLDPTALRIHVYDRILATGIPPTSAEIARHFGVAPADALRALREVKIGKTILPHPKTGEIWMAGPFAALPTQYVVVGRKTKWWANCAWDMLGVAALVKEPVRMDARCTDCGAAMTFQVDAGQQELHDAGVVHFLIPAGHWYDDIGFT
jgi:hypothetical protein